MGQCMSIKGHGPHRGALRGARDGGNIWWVAPSYNVSNEFWRDLKRSCAGTWIDKDEVERRIEFAPPEGMRRGGSVTLKSADRPDSLRGSGLDGLIVDEFASIKRDAWIESLRPTLSDKNGWAALIGTPKGFNLFWDIFQAAENREQWERWQRPSSDNPLISAEELALAREDMGGFAFGQEYEARFDSEGRGIFQREWLAQFVDVAPRCKRYIRYWDKSASETGDYSVGVLMGHGEDDLLYVIDVVRGQWSPHARNEVIEQTAELDVQAYGKDLELWIEKEPGGTSKEVTLIHARLWARFSPRFDPPVTAKLTRWRPFAAQCEAGRVRIARGKWNRPWIDELVNVGPDDREYDHDDQADATAGACNKILLKPEQKPSLPPRGAAGLGRFSR
jgi:predicted phage terminase large subunit-like protein